MPYVGKTPTVGNFVKLDAITTSATDTFNLTNGTVAYSPQSANHCIVSLNGVIQSPTTSFTISGSTIVFASALTSLDVIDFILVLGDVLNIGTPSDATVGFSKVTSNLITGATSETSIDGADSVLIYDDSATALRKMTRTNFVAGIGGVNTPAFFANQTSAQSIANNTIVKIQNNSVDFDSNGTYDNVTNYRFTPAVAGKYFVFAQVAIDGSTDTDVFAWLYKNGSEFIQSNYFYRCTPFVSAIMDLTISDYVEVYAKQVSGTTRNSLASARQNNFGAYKLIGA